MLLHLFVVFRIVHAVFAADANPTFFDKTIDEKAFQKIALISDLKTQIAYIQADGLDLYGVRATPALPSPPPAVLSEWNRLKENDRKSGLPLHGVFFRKDHPFKNYKAPHDSVVLSGLLQKSILLHEYVHFLFQKERLKNPNYQTEEKLDETKADASKGFFSLLSRSSELKPGELDAAGLRLSQAIEESLKAGSIEEAIDGYEVVHANEQGFLKLDSADLKAHLDHALANVERSRGPFRALDVLIHKVGLKTFPVTSQRVDQDLRSLDFLKDTLTEKRSQLK